MSIATEIQRLQEAKADIKAAIEEKGVEVGNGLIDGYADKVDEVYDKGVTDGKKSEYDEFWDSYQENGYKNDYSYAFAGNGWNDNTFNPKYEIIVFYNQGSHLFRASQITNTKKPIRFQKVTSSSSSYVFYGCKNLKTIYLVEVSENQQFSNWFGNCSSLENITFDTDSVIGTDINFQDSPLNVASMLSVIEHLANYKGTNKDLKCKVTFTSECWETLEATTPPEGFSSWKDYVSNGLGWNY